MSAVPTARWSPPTTRRGSASSSRTWRRPSIASRAGEHDAYDVDEVLHQYSRAARELWKFCWLAGAGAGVQRTARVLREMEAEGEPVDWWQLGARRERGAQGASEDARSRLAPGTRPENPTSS